MTKRWEPTGKQCAFLACAAYEALYGGAAGGGKTEALVLGALRYIDRPSYRALVLRRTFPELERDIIPLSHEYYRWADGEYGVQSKTWRFPSGARIEFGHLEGDLDVHKYQGLEAQYIAFDELTTFTEKQYRYLLSRGRSAQGIPVRIRAATNPGGVGHEWVMKRWAPWLESDEVLAKGKLPRARAGEVLTYRNTDAGEVFGEGRLTRAFFPAKIQDNPYIMRNNPEYVDVLGGLDAVTRRQLLEGDWFARPAPGIYFKRHWFKRVLPCAPAGERRMVRRWDLAATQDGGDWTVGVKMSQLPDGTFVIEDVVRERLSSHRVRELVLSTARLDGHECEIALPQDPGQAGKDQVAQYVGMLVGFIVKTRPESGKKHVRAGPVSAQVEAGNVALVRGAWNDPFLAVLEAFPDDGVHDDDVDALSGAFLHLTGDGMGTADMWAQVDLGVQEGDEWDARL